MEIGTLEAKNKFSELLSRAENGQEIVITRRGRPVAKLVAVQASTSEDRARAAAQRIRERARQFGGQFNWEEWKKYRDEGRE